MRSQKYPNSLLFKISGNGFRKPSWLLGTMHMICSNDFVIQEKVLRALRKCNRYFMEVDLGDPSEVNRMQEQGITMKELTADLPVGEKEELEQVLAKQLALSMEEVAQLPPMALINKLTTDAIGCEEIKVPELELLTIAQEAGMITGGLETAGQQLDIAEKVFTSEEIVLQLKASDEYKNLFGEMKTAYQKENLFDLAAFVNDRRFMSRRAFNILVVNRNLRWTKKIPELMEQGSAFIAVGAGHLPGEKGVINLMKQQGFKINPVYQ